MLIEQVDDVNLEPLKRALCGLLDVLWPTVQARQTVSLIKPRKIFLAWTYIQRNSSG
jgi:hypothetical protein